MNSELLFKKLNLILDISRGIIEDFHVVSRDQLESYRIKYLAFIVDIDKESNETLYKKILRYFGHPFPTVSRTDILFDDKILALKLVGVLLSKVKVE